MTPETAWQNTFDQLRRQMPRVTFDTWMQQARLVKVEAFFKEGFREGLEETPSEVKRFTIAAGGEYACEWLTEHMTATTEDMLSGFIGMVAEVRFCTDGGMQDHLERDNLCQYASAQSEGASPDHATQTELLLSEARLSLRDLFVKHEREIAIPGYFRRWIPYLGPTLAWMVVAFRQAYYLKAGCQVQDGGEFSARAEQIIRWSGLARSTFWEAIKDPRLGWFLQQVNDGQRWTADEHTGQPRQKPNRYRFSVAMPLTPGDATALAVWLEKAGIRYDPAEALRLAIESERCAILPEPAPPLIPGHALPMPGAPRSVHEVVHSLCGRLPRRTFAEINTLADELEAHLIPKNDLIFITWYFIQNWVAELGPGAAWLVTLLRDQCFFSRNGSQSRDTVRVSGGAAALAAMLGLCRPKTVDEWLPPLQTRPEGGGDTERFRRKTALRKKVAFFLTRSNGSVACNGSRTWVFRVADYGAEPLLPEHEQAYQALLDIIGAYLESGDREEVNALFTDLARARSGLSPAFSGREADSHNEQTRRDLDSHSGSQGAKRTLSKARNGLILKHLIKTHFQIESLDATITRLESLILPSNGKVFSDETVVVDGKWNLKRLLERSQIGAKRKMIDAGVTSQAFVSRLLYLYSPMGEGLKDGRGWLVSSLLDEPQVGAGSGFDELASLAPAELGRLVQGARSGGERQVGPSGNATWDRCMRGITQNRQSQLAEVLAIYVGDKGYM